MAGEVDCDKWSAKGEGDGVPGVSVLRTTVQEHDLWWRGSPHKRAERAFGIDIDADSANRWRAIPCNSDFGRVVLEERKLVVGNSFNIGHWKSFMPVDGGPWPAVTGDQWTCLAQQRLRLAPRFGRSRREDRHQGEVRRTR